MASHSEKLPLGRMIPPVEAGIEIPAEPPDVGARALSVAARLLCGATTFFFLSFLFAYFYLRSINVDHMWRPSHVKVDQPLGAAFAVCLILSVALAIVSGRHMKREAGTWVNPAAGALAFGLIAVILQCVEYTAQKFGPTDGAFASVFCGWTGLYLIAVLATMYWLETQLATEIRARRQPAGRNVEGDIMEPDKLIAPSLDAAVFYWSFLAAIGIVMYVTLYLL